MTPRSASTAVPSSGGADDRNVMLNPKFGARVSPRTTRGSDPDARFLKS